MNNRPSSAVSVLALAAAATMSSCGGSKNIKPTPEIKSTITALQEALGKLGVKSVGEQPEGDVIVCDNETTHGTIASRKLGIVRSAFRSALERMVIDKCLKAVAVLNETCTKDKHEVNTDTLLMDDGIMVGLRAITCVDDKDGKITREGFCEGKGEITRDPVVGSDDPGNVVVCTGIKVDLSKAQANPKTFEDQLPLIEDFAASQQAYEMDFINQPLKYQLEIFERVLDKFSIKEKEGSLSEEEKREKVDYEQIKREIKALLQKNDMRDVERFKEKRKKEAFAQIEARKQAAIKEAQKKYRMRGANR